MEGAASACAVGPRALRLNVDAFNWVEGVADRCTFRAPSWAQLSRLFQ